MLVQTNIGFFLLGHVLNFGILKQNFRTKDIEVKRRHIKSQGQCIGLEVAGLQVGYGAHRCQRQPLHGGTPAYDGQSGQLGYVEG